MHTTTWSAKQTLLTALVFLFALSLLALASVPAHASGMDRNWMVRAYFDKPLIGRDLARMGLDITSFVPGSHLDAVVNFDELDAIIKHGYEVTVLVEDMDALIRAENAKGFYHTYSQMKAELEAIVAANPDIARLYDIGDTYQKHLPVSHAEYADRDIWALKISDNVDVNEDEVEILYVGAHHARERISTEVPMAFINYLIDGYGTDPMVDYLVNQRELWFVPMLNPDGAAWVAAGHDWRKNRRINSDGTHGVDLNRNYDGCQCGDPDGEWCGVGADSYTWSEVYCGASAFSEPETQSLRDFCENTNGVTDIDGIVAAISYHSYSELVLWAWGFGYYPAPDSATLSRIGTHMAGTIIRESGSGTYEPIQSVLLYPTTGDFDDWMYGEQVTKPKIYSYTIELGNRFQPPLDHIDPICEANRESMIYLAAVAGSPLLAFKGYEIDDGAGDADGWIDPGESIVMPITLANEGLADAAGPTAAISSESPYVSITQGEVSFEDIASSGTGASLPPHFAFDVAPGCPDLTQITFRLDWTVGGESGTDTFKVMVTSGVLFPVLIIDDARGDSVEVFEAALSGGAFVPIVEAAAETDPATWPSYSFVIWCSGTNTDSISRVSWRNALVDYVAAGGRLILEGGEVGYEHHDDADFAAAVLHIDDWHGDSSGKLEILEAAHPIVTTPNTLPSVIGHSYSGWGNEDDVAPTSDATAVLGWSSSGSYASLVAYDAGGGAAAGERIVYMAFDIASTENGAGERDHLIENAFSWIAAQCPDADGDGYEASWCGGLDCDDVDPLVNPGAAEVCEGGVDDDCDGLADGDDPDCMGEFTLELNASYGEGTLSLGFTLGAPVPVVWANYAILTSPSVQVVPLWTTPLPAVDPPVEIPIAFPFPGTGLVGIYTGLYKEMGSLAVDFVWVDTGTQGQ